MVTPDAKRNAVAHARETFGLSELIDRQTCKTARSAALAEWQSLMA